jgi:putative transposase
MRLGLPLSARVALETDRWFLLHYCGNPYNAEHGTAIVIRQVKYLNNILEQDHRTVKRLTRPMLGFKSFRAAQCTLAGVELMHMLKKGQRVAKEGAEGLTPAAQFYALAA